MIVNVRDGLLEFYKGKRIFLTGHTGFKGSWLCHILLRSGAQLTGYALEPSTKPSLFNICGVGKKVNSIIGDISNLNSLNKAFNEVQPEIVIHMAAQPIVRDSYKDPVYTYETNTMGTVNILECVRKCGTVRSFLNVTTDKVYHNNEWTWGYRETDPLDGYDPYSSSKSCSELVTNSYRNSYFADGSCAISTARAGNVIGGGDFSKDRIIPDCVRAAERRESIIVRNPQSVRPYQHVLETLFAYLMIVQKQYEDSKYAGCYNVGPDDRDCITTGQLVEMFCNYYGDGLVWEDCSEEGAVHEADLLRLDCSRIKSVFGWRPQWNIEETVAKTVEWTKTYLEKGDVVQVMDSQIDDHIKAEKEPTHVSSLSAILPHS